ncbi:hypothetical protein U9M48_031841 [Paspalum notatum var. saurae]|uniref:Myb/SANT-like domain-containing protein n=1 Tax=Paspalum notatum var. saurae TaxID=547442 RepID=A0AAQ3U7N3_PASNO
MGTAGFGRGHTAGVTRSQGRGAATLGRGQFAARFPAGAATPGRGQLPAAGHQSASHAARAVHAGRAQFAGTLHYDAALEAAYGDGVYGLGGSGTASCGHAVYGHGTNVEDGDVEAAVQYFREGDDGYIPPDATDDQYYSLDMNGDTSRGRTRGRGLGRSRQFTQPRQVPSTVGRGRGRGRSRGRGLTTSVNDVQPVVSAGQNANATVVNRSTSQRSAKNPVDSQGDMDWPVPEHVSIVCSLFAEQVEKGDLTAWRKLMRRQTGTGWDHLRQTIEMDPEWWRKIKAEILGCAKFKEGPLWNEADLTKMFDKITNDESNHWNPMTENPIIPESQEPIINLEDDFVDAECEIPNDFTSPGSDVVKEVSPSVGNGKKRPQTTLAITLCNNQLLDLGGQKALLIVTQLSLFLSMPTPNASCYKLRSADQPQQKQSLAIIRKATKNASRGLNITGGGRQQKPMLWQLPPPMSPLRATLFAAPGCTIGATDFFDAYPGCPRCAGLPEMRRFTRTVLSRRYAVLAFSSRGDTAGGEEGSELTAVESIKWWTTEKYPQLEGLLLVSIGAPPAATSSPCSRSGLSSAASPS